MNKHVALFFSSGVALRDWKENGTLERDIQIYRYLEEAGWKVSLVTYGENEEQGMLPKDSHIQVLSRPPGLPIKKYGRLISQIHRKALSDVTVIKSHQSSGSGYAAWAALRLGVPFYMRNGYINSFFSSHRGDKPSLQRKIRWEERFAFYTCRVAAVPSIKQADYIVKKYRVKNSKLYPHANWLDVETFRPVIENNPQKARTLIFVGRMENQKRPLDILEAIYRVGGVSLVVVGSGRLDGLFKEKANSLGISIRWLKRVDNEQLPSLMAETGGLILPTEYEGSPKVIMEAMACGLPVISTDGFGVDEWFEDGKHGWKVPVGDLNSLTNAVREWKDHPDEAKKRGAAARRHAEKEFSITAAIHRELNLLDQATAERHYFR